MRFFLQTNTSDSHEKPKSEFPTLLIYEVEYKEKRLESSPSFAYSFHIGNKFEFKARKNCVSVVNNSFTYFFSRSDIRQLSSLYLPYVYWQTGSWQLFRQLFWQLFRRGQPRPEGGSIVPHPRQGPTATPPPPGIDKTEVNGGLHHATKLWLISACCQFKYRIFNQNTKTLFLYFF